VPSNVRVRLSAYSVRLFVIKLPIDSSVEARDANRLDAQLLLLRVREAARLLGVSRSVIYLGALQQYCALQR